MPCTDPVDNIVHFNQGRDVEPVSVDGVQVLDPGRPLLANPDEIMADAQHAAVCLWMRQA